MKRMIKNRMNQKSRRIAAAAVAGLSAAAVVITSVLSGAIEAEAADTLLGIEKLRSRYMESGSEFVILEVVPERKAAEIGYLVDGYEPLLGEWDEEEQVWKSWRNTLCELPKTKRKEFIEGKKEELRAYYKEHGLTKEFPVEAVAAEYEEGEPKQEGFEKIVSDGNKKTGWFQKITGSPAEGTDRYQVAFRYNGLYNDSYEFYEDVLYYNVLSATKIDENLAGGIEDDRPIYSKEDEGVYEYRGTWEEINGAVMTALSEEDDREVPDDEEEPEPDDGEDNDDNNGEDNSDDGDGEDNNGGDDGEDNNGSGGDGEDSSGSGDDGEDNNGSGDGEDNSDGDGEDNNGSGGGEDNSDDGENNNGGGENNSGGDGENNNDGGDNSGSESDGENNGGSAGDGNSSSENGDGAATGAASVSAGTRRDQWIKLVAEGDRTPDGSAGAGDNTKPDDSGKQESPDESEKPEDPGGSGKPEKPEDPDGSGDQENPDGSGKPENPDESEKPEEPEEPDGSGDQENPEEPGDPEEDEPAADDPVDEDGEEKETDAFERESREYYLVAFQKVDDNTEPAANTPMYSVGSMSDIVLSETGEYEFIEWDGVDTNQGRQEYTFAGKEIWCKNTFKSNEWFKKYVLNMDKKDYKSFRIKVLTFTPQELNGMEQIPNFHFLYLNSGLKGKEDVSGNSTVSENNGGEGETAFNDSIKSGLFAADSLPGKWRKLVAAGDGKENTGGGTADEGSGNGNTGGGTADEGSGNGNTGGGTADEGDGSGNTGGGSAENGDGGNTGGSTEDGDDDGDTGGGSTDKEDGDGSENTGGDGTGSVSGNDSGSEDTGDDESESVSQNSTSVKRKAASVSDNDIGGTGTPAYSADNDLSGELLKFFVEKTVAGAVPCLVDGSVLYAKDESGVIAVREALKGTNMFRFAAILCQDNLSEWYEDHRSNYGRLTTDQLLAGTVEDADKNFVEEHVYCRLGNGSDSIINDRFSEATIYSEGGEIEPGFQCVLDEIKLENLYRESDSSGNYKPLSTKISQAKAVRHILNYADRRKVKTKKEIKVLEIQPAMADEPELSLDQIKKWAPGVEKADITVMTTAEFIGKIEKLNEIYDLIYIGTSKDHLNMRYWTDDGYTGKPDKDHAAAGTAFNDSDMDGLIYYNIGDKRVMTVPMAGLLDTEYPGGSQSGWTYFYNYTRYGGNDISREKMNALISFMDGSYPIIIADDFLEQPVTVFEDKEYKGARVNLVEGEYTQAQLSELGVKEADISSVKVKEGYRVTLFNRNNFKGYSVTFDSGDEETYDLSKCELGRGSWDNTAVSLIVEREENATPDRKIDGDHIDNCTYLYEFVEKAMKEKYLNFYAWGDIAENSELFKFYLNRPKVSLEDKAANGELKEGSDIYYIESDMNGRYQLQYKFRIRNEGTASYNTRYRCKLYIDVNSDGKFSGSEEIEDIVLTQGGSQVSADDLYADREYMLTRAVPTGYKGLLPWRVEITQADNPNIYTSMSGYTKLQGMEKEVLKICQINRTGRYGAVINLQTEVNQKGNYFNTLIYGGDHDNVHYPGIADEFELDITTIDIDQFHTEYYANNSYLKDFNMLILGFSDMYEDFQGDAESGPMGAIVDFINSGKSVLLGHDTTSFFNSPGTGNEIKGYPWRNNLSDLRDQAAKETRNAATLNKYVRPLVGMDRYGILQTDVLRRGDVLEKGTGDYDEVLDSGKDVAYKPKSGRKETVPEVHGYTYSLISAKDQKVLIDSGTTSKYQYTKWNMMASGYNRVPEVVFENKYTNIRYDAAYFWDDSKEDDPARYGELENVNNGEVDKVHATQVNQGQITEYPYKLKEDFEVAQTHAQYYQLDYTADDDGDGQSDLVVWYCLGGRTSGDPAKRTTVYSQSPNDVCNNYYIYNKGNITYTGMGHSAGKDPRYTFEEAKLFINTMIASYQAGIRDPQVRVLKSRVPEADEMKLLYRYYDQSNRFSLNDVMTAEGYEKIYFTVEDTNLIKGTRKIASQVYYKDDAGSIEIEADEVTGPNGEKVKQKVRVSPVGGSICSARDDSVVASDNLVSGGVYYVQVPKSIMQKSEDGLDLYFEAQTTLTTNTAKENVYITEKVYAKLRVLQAYLFDLE